LDLHFCCEFAVLPRKISLLVSTCLLLASCTNSQWAQNLERSLEADPALGNSAVLGNEREATPGTTATPTPTLPATDRSSVETVQLPANFPGEIPAYPDAELIAVSPTNQAASERETIGNTLTQTRWRTADAQTSVTQFYQEQFQQNGWQVVEPSGASPQAVSAQRDGLLVTVAAVSGRTGSGGSGNTNPDTLGGTEFVISYLFSDRSVVASPSESPSSPQATPDRANDIDQAPPELQTYITDLQNLGAFSGRESGDFAPNQTVTRREYARWLVETNNLIYANQPARRIRLGTDNEQPAFQDVPSSDPDFSAIQGLANAGLIPSPLSGNATEVTFRPDAPLTREDLIFWKVPIDSRQALPNATIDAVQQTWGFQDTARIEPEALRAVLADFQNGDLSNIRRAFGYTTLFQPQKPVTRAEAAAVLWFFGSQGNGLSAKDALQANRQTNSN
jgi:hypothetical protein